MENDRIKKLFACLDEGVSVKADNEVNGYLVFEEKINKFIGKAHQMEKALHDLVGSADFLNDALFGVNNRSKGELNLDDYINNAKAYLNNLKEAQKRLPKVSNGGKQFLAKNFKK